MTDATPTIYYWPFQGRAGAALRMYAEAGLEVNHVSDFPEIASRSALFGAQTTTLAPPILVDGDFTISQSCAVAMYVGNKVGFPAPPGDHVALMHIGNIVDLYERELTTALKAPEALVEFINGAGGKPGRFTLLAGSIDRAIQGPFFYGEKPSYVDFILTALHSFAAFVALDQFKTIGHDFFAGFPKLIGVVNAITSLPSAAKIGKPGIAGDNFKKSPDAPIFAAFAATEEPAAEATAE